MREMTWINVALIACVIAALGVGFYLVWFIAHPRGLEPAEPEEDDGAPAHGLEDPGGAGSHEADAVGEPR
jgi:hypothetical protein